MNIHDQISALKRVIAHKRDQRRSTDYEQRKLIQLVAKQIRRELREERKKVAA